jgi:xeroderma pigmentosum group C-complementing protein
MVPEGGAYIDNDLGAQAAFILGIDYAPALVGFQFSGRKGTAVLRGVVVAAENEEAVQAVISGINEIKDEEAEMDRERKVLRTWKLFLMNLRIRQRIWAGADSDDEVDNRDYMEADDAGGSDVEAEKGAEGEANQSDADNGAGGGGGFEIDDDYAGGFVYD